MLAIGIQPRMELAVQAGLKTQRGIIVDDHLRTSAPDVFAAGDVAQVFDAQSGQYLLNSLWTPAIQQGRAAGANMAGGDVIYEKKFPFNVTRLAGLVTTLIGRVGKSEAAGGRPRGDADVAGIMRGDSELWRLSPEAVAAQTYAGDNRLRLYLKDNVMVGAVVMGDQTLSRPIQVFIQQQVDLGELRQRHLAGRRVHADLEDITRARAPHEGVADLDHLDGQPVDVGEYPARPGIGGFALRAQVHPPRRAVEQRDAETPFEFGDALADVGRGDAKLLCGRHEA